MCTVSQTDQHTQTYRQTARHRQDSVCIRLYTCVCMRMFVFVCVVCVCACVSVSVSVCACWTWAEGGAPH